MAFISSRGGAPPRGAQKHFKQPDLQENPGDGAPGRMPLLCLYRRPHGAVRHRRLLFNYLLFILLCFHEHVLSAFNHVLSQEVTVLIFNNKKIIKKNMSQAFKAQLP